MHSRATDTRFLVFPPWLKNQLFNADYDVVLPAAIGKATKFFVREMKKLPKAFAMVHSKVALVDPFGDPVRGQLMCYRRLRFYNHSAVC
jgi:hypothetical protein